MKTTKGFSRYFDLSRFNSLTAGTPVETEDGQKPIEEIKIGNKVLAEDPETGEQGYFEVVALTDHPTDEILKVTVEAEAKAKDKAEKTATLDSSEEAGNNQTEQLNSDGGIMEVTPEHPIYVEGKGWLWAENLAIGDRLRRADGGVAKVLAVERVKLAEPEPVYNFTVKGPHTYFVLEVGVLVHNSNCSPMWDEKVQRWRDPQTGQFTPGPDNEPINTPWKIHPDKAQIPGLYENRTNLASENWKIWNPKGDKPEILPNGNLDMTTRAIHIDYEKEYPALFRRQYDPNKNQFIMDNANRYSQPGIRNVSSMLRQL